MIETNQPWADPQIIDIAFKNAWEKIFSKRKMRAFNEIASPDFKVLGLFIWNVQIGKAPYKEDQIHH